MDFLGKDFISKFEESAPSWKENPLGEFVCRRTYCRVKDNGEYESWRDIVERVVNGTYALQKKHVEKNGLGWDERKGVQSAREMFEKMYHMKFSPPGRGLWAMGTDITEKRGIFAALNNCGFTTTKDIKVKGSEPFRFLMDMSMLGVGIGFDLKGAKPKYRAHVRNLRMITNSANSESNASEANNANSASTAPQIKNQEFKQAETQIYLQTYIAYIANQIKKIDAKLSTLPPEDPNKFDFVRSALKSDREMYEWEYNYVSGLTFEQIKIIKIEDTREGWVNSTGAIIDSYLVQQESMDANSAIVHSAPQKNIVFYYGDIREAGRLLKTFGGLSSGPEPLLDLHIMIRKMFQTCAESDSPFMSETLITDTMNLIGKCVVAGNVRRSSEIVLGDPNSDEFINLKNYELNPERSAWGWCSNNSVYAEIGMDYTKFQDLVKINGEPGFFWLDNVRKFSRMNGKEDNKDRRAIGTNPCITGDTLISTSKGQVAVRDLVGKQFTARVGGKEYPSTEAGFWSNGVKQVYKIILESGDTLKATEDHIIYTTEGPIPAKKLIPSYNEVIIEKYPPVESEHWSSVFSKSKVFSVEPCGNEEVFDCTIIEVHCFIANGMKVHNCSEQSLEDKELCCLVEVYPARHETKEEFLRTLKFAYLYGKTVTLGDSHWVPTNRVMMRNRRIGCSLTGIVQFLAQRNIETLREWLTDGYAEIQKWDAIYSDWLAIMRSIKTTSIKPSGCLAQDTVVRVVDFGENTSIASTDGANANTTTTSTEYQYKDMTLFDICASQGFVKHAYNGVSHEAGAILYPKPGEWMVPSTDIYILNKDNLPEKVSKLFYNGEVDVVELPFEDGVVRCTPNHKFLLSTGEWRCAKDLREGDDVVSYSH